VGCVVEVEGALFGVFVVVFVFERGGIGLDEPFRIGC